MAYGFAYTVTIEESLCGTADSTDFPLTFTGTYDGTGGEPDLRTVANGGDVQNTVSVNGITVPADFIFASDSGGTLLKWEVKFYNPVTGQIVAFVRVPTLSTSTDTVIYILYGDAGVTTWQGDVPGTWSAGFFGVYHFPDGTTLTVEDSSPDNSDGTTHGGVSAGSGQIGGGCLALNGSTGYVDTASSWTAGSGMTVTAWVNISNFANSPVVVRWKNSGDGYFLLNPSRQMQLCNSNACPGAGTRSNEAISASTWTHIAGVQFDGAVNMKLYINGVECTYVSQITDDISSGSNLSFGSSFGSSEFLTGSIDELRIAEASRSASWILAEYNNQSSPSTFYTLASTTANITLTPAAASLTFTGATPTLDTGLSPVAASLVFTGGTPTVTLVGFNLTPAAASLVFTGGTPIINITNLTPAAGQLVFLGGTPGVSLVLVSATGTKIIIGGTEYQLREESPLQISKTLSAAWSATFSLRWYGATLPVSGAEVAFFWEGTKRFGGLVLDVSETSIKGNFTESILTVRCTGYQSYLDRTIVAKLYTIPIGGVPVIIIYDLWQNHLKQFGVTLNYPQGAAISIAVQLFHYITVMEAAARLQSQSPGYDHIIDDNKEWKWFLSPNTAAPFTLRNSDSNVDTMTLTRSSSRFRNSQWVLPAVDLMGFHVDTIIATAGQVNFATLYPPGVSPIIRRNGTLEAVTTLGDWDGSPWYYIDGGQGVFRTPGAPVVGAGDTVTVSYPNPFPLGFNVRDEASITAVGLYEAVHQAKDATSEAECLQIAAGLLDLYGTNGSYPQKLVFTYNSTNQIAWLAPGMELDVDRTFPRAIGDYNVEQVISTLEKLKVWRHTVTCRAGLGEVTDRQALEAFRTSGRVWVNVPPIVVTMEIGIDQYLSVGTIPNTYRFRGSGTVSGWDARFKNDPPQGTDMIIDLLLNGTSIFLSGNANKINIGAGVTTEYSGILFVSNNIAYNDGDILTMNIIQVGSTVPGKNGLVHLNLKPNTALPPA